MARTKYKKKIKNGIEYYFYRINDNRLEKPKDLYAKTVKELEEKINNTNKLLENNINIKAREEKYRDFIENYLYNVKFLNIKNTSKATYEYIYMNHIRNNKITKLKIKDINRLVIQNFYEELRKKGIGIPTIRIVHYIISGSIKYAYENDLIIRDFSNILKVPKPTQEEKLKKENRTRALTKKEQENFIKAIKDDELELFYLIALYTGMRKTEIIALTWNDIDFENKTININKIAKYQHEVKRGENGKCKIMIQTPKTKKSIRKIPFPGGMKNKILKHKKEQLELKLKLGVNYNKNNLVFCKANGEYLKELNIYLHFKKIMKNIKANHTFHDLRHTYATRLFELGESPKTVQELLGHSTIDITLNIYTHVLEDIKKNAVSKIDKLYKELE